MYENVEIAVRLYEERALHGHNDHDETLTVYSENYSELSRAAPISTPDRRNPALLHRHTQAWEPSFEPSQDTCSAKKQGREGSIRTTLYECE